MARATKGNIPQRRRVTREPQHALLDDIDNQPRSSGLVAHNPAQRKKKVDNALRNFAARRILTTTAMLKKRTQERHQAGEDDQVYTQVLMDLEDEGEGSSGLNGFDSDSDHDIPTNPTHQIGEEWEEEEVTEEQLLYFQAKGLVQDFELKDYRQRRRKIILDQERWDDEMPDLVDAYLDHCHRRRSNQLYSGEVREKHIILVWSIFEHATYEIPVFCSDRFQNASYIRSGFLPFNPLVNKSLVSLEVVELYHSLFMRCPRLGVQPFIRALCDLQGVRFKNNLSVQFSSAYDLYIRLIQSIRLQVSQALGRATPNWRMLNTCPACQYEVRDEPTQPIRMMAAVDGNNSLKRFQRHEPTEDGMTRVVKERPDTRVGGGDFFLQPEQVDLWDEPNWRKWVDWVPTEKAEKKSCEDRWSNLNERKTARSFGYFDVNGIFAGFCRHSFVLIFADMIKTGEQSKYMLSLLHHFMSACREDRRQCGLPNEPQGTLGIGYDIACGMVDKIARSPLNQLAKDEKLQMLIGLLHGFAHNRLCQLSFLMLYIHGAGIEDLEVCERYFSQSNALASVTRYMSRFRRRQAIASYAYHRDNFETYHNLSKFLYSNYKQALGILNRSKDTARTLQLLGILDADMVFGWLQEEKEYLESRNERPEKETLASAYYLALVKLSKCQERLRRARNTFREELGATTRVQQREESAPLFLTERQMANEQEMEAKLLVDVQSLEERLGLRRDQRWSRDCEEWNKAAELVSMSKYQKALDKLEGLIVSRIFELSRMNVSGTGYKMRQHIGHAMKKRSAAIQSALEDYNEAAATLDPPRKLLNWDDVLNYTYLSEFDFLRDTRNDVRNRIWAKPAVREAVSELFKLIRAGEEIDRLHIEIKRLLTYMKEEEEYLPAVARHIQATNPALAYQIRRYANERGRFNAVHRMRLLSIRKLKGFSPLDTHYFQPGIGVRKQTAGEIEEHEAETAAVFGEEEDDDESEGEDEEAEADERAEAVLAIANDTV